LLISPFVFLRKNPQNNYSINMGILTVFCKKIFKKFFIRQNVSENQKNKAVFSDKP